MSYLLIHSTDVEFLCRLVDWLNEQEIEIDSTSLRVLDTDPCAEEIQEAEQRRVASNS